MMEWSQGTVLKNKHWNDHLHSLEIALQPVDFIAGQYTRLALDIDGVKVARPYSYVNPPATEPLEFYFNSVPGGPLSNRLMALEAGDHIWVSNQSTGFLTLAELPAGRHLWMLATGTAIGPFLSMLRIAEPWQRFERVLLAYAVRHEEDLSYAELLNQIQSEHSERFDWIPFISRESVPYAMGGHIPAAISDGSLEARFGVELDSTASQVMICGNPAMVKDTLAVLKGRGLQKNLRRAPGQVTVERYW